MPRWTWAIVPAKISAIAAPRQTMVSLSEVIRSMNFRSMILTADRLEERDELRLLLFHQCRRTIEFEKPGPPSLTRPGCQDPCGRAAHIDCADVNIAGVDWCNHRLEHFSADCRQADLLSPPIDVVHVAAAIARKRHD